MHGTPLFFVVGGFFYWGIHLFQLTNMGKKPITTRGREKSIWESFKRKFMAITRKTKPYSYEERLKKLAKIWSGRINNYRPASIHVRLKALDVWLRNAQHS